MPIKRRTPKARDHRVTPAAVEAYRAGDWMGLHRALGLRPWQASPLDVPMGNPYPDGSPWAASWPLAAALRAELEVLSPRVSVQQEGK